MLSPSLNEAKALLDVLHGRKRDPERLRNLRSCLLRLDKLLNVGARILRDHSPVPALGLSASGLRGLALSALSRAHGGLDGLDELAQGVEAVFSMKGGQLLAQLFAIVFSKATILAFVASSSWICFVTIYNK